jgi:tripartite-type tricarboxylate transporter receptor subunit TctC
MKSILSYFSCLFIALPTYAMSQSPTDFYKGRTVFLQIGSGSGGAYDLTGRLFARHMGPYIDGAPKLVPQNIPGGGSLNMANNYGKIAARDGSVYGVFNSGMATTPLLMPEVAHFDPRTFNFLGSPSREAHILVAWHDSPLKNMQDVFEKEIIVGATSPGGAPYEFPFLTNILIGTKFKIITGYKSSSETKLAMERGEIHAEAGLGWATAKSDRMSDIQSGRLKIIASFAFTPHPDLVEYPAFPSGRSEEDRQIFRLMYARQAYGRPFATPPDVPRDRVTALRTAFEKTMKDSTFLEEAKRLSVDINPVSAEELTRLTEDLFKTPQSVLKRIHSILGPPQTP